MFTLTGEEAVGNPERGMPTASGKVHLPEPIVGSLISVKTALMGTPAYKSVIVLNSL